MIVDQDGQRNRSTRCRLPIPSVDRAADRPQLRRPSGQGLQPARPSRRPRAQSLRVDCTVRLRPHPIGGASFTALQRVDDITVRQTGKLVDQAEAVAEVPVYPTNATCFGNPADGLEPMKA